MNFDYSEKLNSVKNIDNSVLKMKRKAYEATRTALDNYYNVRNDEEIKQIIFRDYVLEDTKTSFEDEELFNRVNRGKREDLVRWIIRDGYLSIQYFINDNKDNASAMAMLDFNMCAEYANKISNMQMNVFQSRKYYY